MIELYGIPNCHTVKKAQSWLAAHAIEYTFINFKKQAPTRQKIEQWLTAVPLTSLLNKKGTTWRKLTPEQQLQAENEQGAIALMCAQPSLIKRPVLVSGNHSTQVGFTETQYQQLFQTQTNAGNQ